MSALALLQHLKAIEYGMRFRERSSLVFHFLEAQDVFG
jgi:hypothetical protein